MPPLLGFAIVYAPVFWLPKVPRWLARDAPTGVLDLKLE